MAEGEKSAVVNCTQLDLQEVSSLHGPGRFMLSCEAIELNDSVPTARLRIGNPNAVSYHRLVLTAEWADLSITPSAEPGRAKIEVTEVLAPSQWLLVEVPLQDRHSGLSVFGRGLAALAEGEEIDPAFDLPGHAVVLSTDELRVAISVPEVRVLEW